MSYRPDPDAYEDARNEFLPLEACARRLRWRRGLHPMDPDALDDDEMDQLEDLEQRMDSL